MIEKFKQLLEGALAFFQVRAPSKTEERRRLIRLRCDYTVQCVVEQQQFEAHIIDMGLNGMRLRMNHKLKPGSNVFVYHPTRSERIENEYVLCLVRWSRKRRESEELETGLQYADTPGNMRRSWVKFLLKELGFDACIDYKAGNLWKDIKEATPKGVDCLFENVGGEIFDTLLARMNAFSRIALCGLIAQYNSEPYPMKNIGSVLVNRIRMQGFIVSEHMERWPQALKELGQGVATGKIKYRETVAEGLENAPKAFIGLLKGANLGKQLVKLI